METIENNYISVSKTASNIGKWDSFSKIIFKKWLVLEIVNVETDGSLV